MRRRPIESTRPLRCLLVAGLLALLPPAPSAVAAPADAPRLAVKRVAVSPVKVAVGESVSVRGKVVNRGERGAKARPRIRLRGLSGAPVRIARLGAGRVGPGEARKFAGPVGLPSDLAAGSYRLAACLRKRGNRGPGRCKAAPGELTLAGAAGDGGAGTPVGPGADFTPGARTLGDPLFPQIGNGGYDARHYEIELDYDPAMNRFKDATTTLDAVATQNLSQLSLDFQEFDVSKVTVDGVAAAFTEEATSPPLGDPSSATQPRKLVVTPAAGIPAGQAFEVAVSYSGALEEVVDADESSEGWICTPSGSSPCEGAFVVNQPIGAQGWFPSNNHPSDKATFDTAITVPDQPTRVALGIGELVSSTANGNGTRTWRWSEDDPTATYLTTATNGLFDYTESTVTEAATPPRSLAYYEAIDVTYAAAAPATIRPSLDQGEAMLNFLRDLYGPYPFDSTGAVVDNAPTVGYALEVQTKPHFSLPSVNRSTLLHEIAHQWMGNAVTLETWADIWFNEGWAAWSEWRFAGPAVPAQNFQAEYADPSNDWSIAPAVLDGDGDGQGDPENLFDSFAVYTRGAMTLEGYRQIVGDDTFLDFAKALQTQFAYGNVTTAEVIQLAKTVSGFSGAELTLLDRYFQEWLYGTEKPETTPEDFPPPPP